MILQVFFLLICTVAWVLAETCKWYHQREGLICRRLIVIASLLREEVVEHRRKELEAGDKGNRSPQNAELASQVPGPPKGRAATTRLGSQPLMRPRERLVFFQLGVKMQEQGQKEISTM